MGKIMAPPFRHLWIALMAFLLLGLGWPQMVMAETGALRIGIVLMHGKGGSPTRLGADLGAALEGPGFRGAQAGCRPAGLGPAGPGASRWIRLCAGQHRPTGRLNTPN